MTKLPQKHPTKLRIPNLFITSAILIVLFIATTVIAIKAHTVFQTGTKSTFTLAAKENKFNLNFDFKRNAEQDFLNVLEKLSLPASIKEGVTFELDATSSSKLTFMSPVWGNIDASDNKITFSGKLAYSPIKEKIIPQSLKVPASSNFIAASVNMHDFFISRFNLPKEFTAWIDTSFKPLQNGEVIVIFGEGNMALITTSENLDTESLKNIKSGEESAYREEMINEIKLHLVKIPESTDDERTFAIFSQNGKSYMVSSYEGAKAFINANNDNADTYEFNPDQETTSLIVLFRNTDDAPAGEELYRMLDLNKPQFIKSIKNLEKAELKLNQKDFSSSISVK